MSRFPSVTRSTSYKSKPEQKERKNEKIDENLASILEGKSPESPRLRQTAIRPKLDVQTREKLEASEREVATHAREDSGSESAEDASNIIQISRTETAPGNEERMASKPKIRPVLQRQEKKTSIQKVVSEKPKSRTGLIPRQRQFPRPSPRPLNFSGQLPSLPQVPGEPEIANEANLNEELFNFDAIETLLDPGADAAKIQTILSGTREEHETSSGSASQIESSRSKPKDLDEVVKELEEFKKFVILEERSDTKQPVRAMPNFMSQNLAPATSKKMAETVKLLIERNEGDKRKSDRALNILYCAAGGHRQFCLPIAYPETDACADALTKIPLEKRSEYLNELYLKLKQYLSPAQQELIEPRLKNIEQCSKLVTEIISLNNYLKHLRTEIIEEMEKIS
ncbi:hypothetical protein H6CHR_00273 [Variovorax sp. PBL-H6]|uniref:hypothetical protein n=1 Tax=Variovorax sp. PBL-H6 TaxID=434009 RepID=UPI001318FF80|nr:hypothetical protein [Variovorax sp. PBL-H6]VTU15566.1 hypothetical protein H6CHR_00273 [Variovorax sp. PBL-H6]